MVASSQVVNGYVGAQAGRGTGRTRWDFEEENPLRDARGFDVGVGASDHLPGRARRGPRPGQRDPDQRRAAVRRPRPPRVLLAGGHRPARRGAVGQGRRAGHGAGAPSAPCACRAPPPIQLYKNNTDGKGASYGTHENYLVARQTPFAELVRHLTPFFVSRQVVTGAGRVGIGQDGRGDGLPARPAGRLLRGRGRPRDHPQAADHQHPRRAARRPGASYRRLHVIIGDANLAEVATYLKVGTTALVLAMIEQRWLTEHGIDLGVDGPVGGAARGLARPGACAPAAHAARRAPADGRAAADGVPRAGPQVRRGPLGERRRRADPRRAGPLGVGARPARDRPDVARRRARLGRQAAAARGLPRARGPGLGRRQAAPGRPAVLRRAAGQGACTTGWSRAAG